jgi:FkbM family methyltransferase
MQKDEVLQGSWKSVKILPHAIGNPLRKTLYLTNQPGLSSQLPPNGEVFKTYLNSNEWHVREEVVVNVKSLDDSLTEEVDFLKIDTQGTELEILKSGLSRVLPNCLMIYCEITYIKLYQDMYSYPEFLLFMEENGFEILDIKRTSSKRLNEDNLYSKREFSWSHTLFIKKDFSGLNEIKLKKLICLLVSLEYFDYASYLARNFLKQESFKELLESIKNYSKAFNIVLQKSMNSWEYSKVSRNQLKDRDFER